MRPKNLTSKIFLDGGDPHETRQIMDLLGFLDGQTTNPTLIAKNPVARKKLEKGGRFSEKEIINFYHFVVREISGLFASGFGIGRGVRRPDDQFRQNAFAGQEDV